ncbi:hypothetical protein [Sansalvadorimonas verongulae]|uniref:hypothetical protein n=1 Tax=Sansalvadorimonas verongulae TaxID=2172824 RepID=UPI0012BC7751|nr:hypothetical protein [Sansalvadorimonas verongulae]MTI14701.1 hypothetical protein [Sansalvadorimonas verongulae]
MMFIPGLLTGITELMNGIASANKMLGSHMDPHCPLFTLHAIHNCTAIAHTAIPKAFTQITKVDPAPFNGMGHMSTSTVALNHNTALTDDRFVISYTYFIVDGQAYICNFEIICLGALFFLVGWN